MDKRWRQLTPHWTRTCQRFHTISTITYFFCIPGNHEFTLLARYWLGRTCHQVKAKLALLAFEVTTDIGATDYGKLAISKVVLPFNGTSIPSRLRVHTHTHTHTHTLVDLLHSSNSFPTKDTLGVGMEKEFTSGHSLWPYLWSTVSMNNGRWMHPVWKILRGNWTH